MCPPRTSRSSPETVRAPVEIRRFSCGQPAAAGAPRTQPRSGRNPRAPRGFCRVVGLSGGGATKGARPSRPQRQHRSRGLRISGAVVGAEPMRAGTTRAPESSRRARILQGCSTGRWSRNPRSAAFTPLHRSNVVAGPTLPASLTLKRHKCRAPGPGSARGPRAGLGGPPKPSFPSLPSSPGKQDQGTMFSAGRRKRHASGVRSPGRRLFLGASLEL